MDYADCDREFCQFIAKRRNAMAQVQNNPPADAAQLRRDLCLAFESQDEARLFSLSKQIDQMQLVLFRQAEKPCIPPEN